MSDDERRDDLAAVIHDSAEGSVPLHLAERQADAALAWFAANPNESYVNGYKAAGTLIATLAAERDEALRRLAEATEAADRNQQRYWDEQKWAKIVHDLDRSEWGRHEGDAEGQTPGGVSLGNPHLRTGQCFGYTMDGNRIVLPPREQRHDLNAWIQPRASLPEGEPT